MLIRDQLKLLFFTLLLILPVSLALYIGLGAGMDRADFVFVNQGEVSSLDPALATGIPEGRILMAVYEGLCALDPKTSEPYPACAESYEITNKGKIFTFKIRKGLKWSNGAPLIAQDFERSWTRLLDKKIASPYAYLLWDLDPENGLSAPDDYTFQVKLKNPCPYFPVLCAFYPLFPVYEKEAMVFNGPFYVEKRLLKDRIRLKKNPHYWDRDQVKLNTIDALAITSPMTALNLYLTGEADWINNTPPIVLPYVKGREDFSLTPNLGVNFIRFNTTMAPLNNPKVRKALFLAINKEELTQYVLKGEQIPADSFTPPGLPGYAPPRIKNYDPIEAKRLLSEAGFAEGKGFPQLNLLYSSDETNRDICEVISLQLREHLKIKIHPAAQERKGYFVSQNALKYHLVFCSWLGDYLDVSTFLDVFHSQSGNNRTGWKNKRYDELLSQGAHELDGKKRLMLLAEAEALLLESAPIAPLYFRTTANMIHPQWAGYYDNIQDVHPLKHIHWKAK